jgi:Ca2+-transporting ATPase
MQRPPRPPQQTVFSNGRGLHMIWVGLLMGAICLGAQAWAIKNHLHWQTIVFNVLCLSQMGHVLAIRSDKQSLFSIGLFSNKPLMGAVALTIILQLTLTFSPLLQPIFKTEALTATELSVVIVSSSLVFWAVEMEKIFSRKKTC